jgi:hypothetical protein
MQTKARVATQRMPNGIHAEAHRSQRGLRPQPNVIVLQSGQDGEELDVGLRSGLSRGRIWRHGEAFDCAPEKNALATLLVAKAGASSTRLDPVIPCQAASPQSRLCFTGQRDHTREILQVQAGERSWRALSAVSSDIQVTPHADFRKMVLANCPTEDRHGAFFEEISGSHRRYDLGF